MTHYYEKVSSNRTETLFLVLTLLFLVLSMWRVSVAGLGSLGVVFFILFIFFLFYSLNYRTLVVRLTPAAVELRFGLFTWRIAMDNIEKCFLDDTSLWRIGGAGIHFSWFHGRYRAMSNFIEHPRVVIALKKKRGPVRDVAFSTRRPNEVLRFIQEAMSTRSTEG
jgi:hypothetical protein